eukprot:CAMPEP_0202960832 /NCGR_PEP_ID=MMETSP1396-20130829/4986_1 /ASSEMBLY_ACC=CAM_ASM_000872 /TAXON_ID= /ORGANISM="Pseudokeronopsis sp., Strain Brazil" /LENGTH=339 /DNA_ID=CAMNT_0049680315 /DNA_START=20 /DNA_END=1039 /DNA_ORIENTATION=+
MLSKSVRPFSKQVKPRVTQLLINGKFVNSTSGKTFDTFNPATEEKIASVQEADKQDVELAVRAARKALDEGPWGRMKGEEKGKLMHKLADLMEKNIDELAALESMDNGKPFLHSKFIDIPLTLQTIRYYAGWADKIHGRVLPYSVHPNLSYTVREPVGVAGMIIPWNFPLAMLAWKLGPMLASGCTGVLKPAEQTPLTALRVGELMMEAGFPEGVVNVLPGFGPTAGRALSQHPLVDKVAFTGSTEVGKEIKKSCHDLGYLKRVTLELGGKSPNIIMDDANLDLAVNQAMLALYLNQGQCCIAGSRLFVHEKIHDAFLEKVVAASKQKVVGDPFDEKTD